MISSAPARAAAFTRSLRSILSINSRHCRAPNGEVGGTEDGCLRFSADARINAACHKWPGGRIPPFVSVLPPLSGSENRDARLAILPPPAVAIGVGVGLGADWHIDGVTVDDHIDRFWQLLPVD